MSFNVAMMVFLNSDHYNYMHYAKYLLKYFVKTFEQIYGCYLVSHNIHEFLHLGDDLELHLLLDNCSTFVFKNYM